MVSFRCDYQTGGHPKVMAALCDPKNNLQPEPGYGSDRFTEKAIARILAHFGVRRNQCKALRFVSGGTQANLLAIDAMLSRTGAVIAVESGHINVHESGAIERTGHKIVALKGQDGKLTAAALHDYLNTFYSDESNRAMPQPELVYISQPTELGTEYSLDELSSLREVIDAYHLKLYVDGARLATVLCEYNLGQRYRFYQLCDAFSIGGTKCGALFGEALVFSNYKPQDIDILTKQHGALMAKGRIIAQQFITLFEDGLYEQIGYEEVQNALRVKSIFTANGFPCYIDSPTNQQFFIIPKEKREFLAQHVAFEKWCDTDANHIAIRLVTAWSTTQQDLDTLAQVVAEMAAL